MSFQYLPVGVVAAGLAALAVGLFLLQRLRVRHRRREVVTTLFWQAAVEEARARVLVQRFRHPLAYALLLLITALVWLAAAGPQAGARSGREIVLLLDASAGMAREGRFEAARSALREQLAAAPRDRRRVIVCGARPRSVLLPGEDERLLDHRLEGLAPEACPSTMEAVIRRVALGIQGPGVVRVFGDAPVGAALLGLLPTGLRVERQPLEGEPGGNRGLVALGVTDPASGRWDQVDVFLEVRGAGAGEALVEATVDGVAVRTAAERSGEPERLVLRLRDLPAQGGLLEVRLPGGDSLALDDAARVRLPDRPLIRVALADSLAAQLGPVLRADPAVVLVDAGADVAVRRAGEGVGGDAPALELVPPAIQEEAFLLTHEEGLASRQVLLEAFTRLGLDEIDATDLARQTGRVVELGARPGPRRGIGVHETLLSEGYDFVRARSFPLFVALAVRWLSGAEAGPAWVAAGEALAGVTGPFADDSGRRLDPAGAPFVPLRAGSYAGERTWLAAALLDPETTLGAAGVRLPGPGAAGASGGAAWATILLALALLLLALEWYLLRTGRIP